MKDAIIIFGGGCTGEIVSNEGLIFTNHHCGYGAIASASTVEKNYLRDGFYAKNKQEEIPSKGLSVQFLVRVEDVTAKVDSALKGASASDRAQKLQAVTGEIISAATAGNGYEARVNAMFKGNQYILLCTNVIKISASLALPPKTWASSAAIRTTGNGPAIRATSPYSVYTREKTANPQNMQRTIFP